MHPIGKANSELDGNTSFKKSLMKNNLLLLLFLLPLTKVSSQTPGSIAFLGYQTNAPDGFAFVTLQDFAPNSQIYFTDNGWDGSALFQNEDILVWTSPSTTTPAGTIVYIYDDNIANSSSPLDGPGTVTGELPNLSSSGDQVLAFTGSEQNPQFIAAISNSDFLSVCAEPGVPNNNATCLPSPLIVGSSAQTPVNSSTIVTNMYFTPGTFTGTPAQLLVALMNPGNWTISNDINVAGAGQWPGWNFSLNAAAPVQMNFASGNISITEGAASATVTCNFLAPTSGNQTIQIQLSGALQSADFQANPAFNGNVIPLSIPGGSTSISFTVQALADGSTEGTETGSLSLVNPSSGILIGTPNQISISVNEPSNVSIVNFETDEVSQNEDGNSISISVVFEPPVIQNGTLEILISKGIRLLDTDFQTFPSAVDSIINIEVLAGQTDVTLDVLAVDDLIPESDEQLTFSIGTLPNGMVLGVIQELQLSISENDQNLVPTGIFINEVMTSNSSTIVNVDTIYSDWIEIYNAGNTEVNLANLYVSDEPNNPFKYQFPGGTNETIIPAGGFKLIWADDSTELGALHTNFKLSAGGEFLGLSAAANSTNWIDSLNIPVLTSDQSYGSVTDGSSTRAIFEPGFTTVGISNNLSSIKPVELTHRARVFPNPCNNQFEIRCEKDIPVLIQMLDLSGRVLKMIENKNSISNFSVYVDLPAGMYSIVLQFDDTIEIQKLVIH